MKVVLKTGSYEIHSAVIFEYLRKKGTPFCIYREEYFHDLGEYRLIYVPEEEYDTLDDFDFHILPSFIEEELLYKYLQNEIFLDLNKVRYDKDFIEIVEELEPYDLSVEEIPSGTIYKISMGYSGYSDDWYEKIEFYKEDEWKVAE